MLFQVRLEFFPGTIRVQLPENVPSVFLWQHCVGCLSSVYGYQSDFGPCFQPLLHPHSGSCYILLRAPDDQVITIDGTMDPFWEIVQSIIHKDDEECG